MTTYVYIFNREEASESKQLVVLSNKLELRPMRRADLVIRVNPMAEAAVIKIVKNRYPLESYTLDEVLQTLNGEI